MAYCSQRCHVLWDLHHEDALITGNAGCSKPHLMLLDVFMPPDELLVCVLLCSFLHLSGLVLAFIVGAEILSFLPCSMTVHWLLFPPSFLSLVLFDSFLQIIDAGFYKLVVGRLNFCSDCLLIGIFFGEHQLAMTCLEGLWCLWCMLYSQLVMLTPGRTNRGHFRNSGCLYTLPPELRPGGPPRA